jgi:hypothetical protein
VDNVGKSDAPVWPEHLLLRVSGVLVRSLATPVEAFSFGLRLGCKVDNGTTPADTSFAQPAPEDAVLRRWLKDTVAPAVTNLFSTPLLAKECLVTQIGLNAIVGGGPTPKYRSLDPVYIYPGQIGDVPEIKGKSTTTNMQYHYPPQVALCVSTVTAARRGYSAKGRFYLPAPTADLADDWRLPQAHASTYAGLASTFVKVLRLREAVLPPPAPELPGVWLPCIVSPHKNGTGPGGTVHAITGVRVGRVLDTIRSRRTSLVEDYESSAVTW